MADLLAEPEDLEAMPLLAGVEMIEKAPLHAEGLVDAKLLDKLPARFRKAADEAITLFRFFENKQTMNFAPAFTCLLGVIDEAARGLVVKKLTPHIPAGSAKEKDWFCPYLDKIDHKSRRHYEELARNLKKTLILQNGLSPVGLLRNCLDHALNDPNKPGGVFDAVRVSFKFAGGRNLLDAVVKINNFRNTRIAHQEKPLDDVKEAKGALVKWIDGLVSLWESSR